MPARRTRQHSAKGRYQAGSLIFVLLMFRWSSGAILANSRPCQCPIRQIPPAIPPPLPRLSPRHRYPGVTAEDRSSVGEPHQPSRRVSATGNETAAVSISERHEPTTVIPHLGVYKFTYTMSMSILNRITGVANTVDSWRSCGG
jgi:hypothetical protein